MRSYCYSLCLIPKLVPHDGSDGEGPGKKLSVQRIAPSEGAVDWMNA